MQSTQVQSHLPGEGEANKHLPTGCQNQPRGKYPSCMEAVFSDGRKGLSGENLAVWIKLLFGNDQPASYYFSSTSPRLCLSLQSAVGAEGTGTDVTGSGTHPFSTLPVLIGCSRAVATAQCTPSPPPPPNWASMTCLRFVWRGFVWRGA